MEFHELEVIAAEAGNVEMSTLSSCLCALVPINQLRYAGRNTIARAFDPQRIVAATGVTDECNEGYEHRSHHVCGPKRHR
jgi:hypothetical protein